MKPGRTPTSERPPRRLTSSRAAAAEEREERCYPNLAVVDRGEGEARRTDVAMWGEEAFPFS